VAELSGIRERAQAVEGSVAKIKYEFENELRDVTKYTLPASMVFRTATRLSKV
jgi:hypothetical protein